MSDGLRVELSPFAMVVIVIGVFATFGTIALWLWWMIRYRYPFVVDRDGVTTRSGARHRWADAKEVLTLRRRSSRGLRISFAGGGRIFVVPRMIRDGDEVVAFIEACGVRASS